jgi:hypothetical protein
VGAKTVVANNFAAPFVCGSLLLLLALTGCGSSTSMATSTPRTQNPLTGNWLVTGSLPNAGPGAFPFPPSPSFGLAVSLDVVGEQVIASYSDLYTCGNSGGGGAGYLATAQIAADGSFTLQAPALSGFVPTIIFTVNGAEPQTVGGTWSGTYSATNANAGCIPVSGSFTAVPIQPVTGTFAGSANLGTGSSGSPVNLSIVLQQGSAGFVTAPNFVNSQNVLSGSIAVQGTSCFTKGSLSLGQGSVDGGSVEAQFVMDDGSKLFFTAAIEDTATSKIKLNVMSVAGGQCDKLFAVGNTDLVRQ